MFGELFEAMTKRAVSQGGAVFDIANQIGDRWRYDFIGIFEKTHIDIDITGFAVEFYSRHLFRERNDLFGNNNDVARLEDFSKWIKVTEKFNFFQAGGFGIIFRQKRFDLLA